MLFNAFLLATSYSTTPQLSVPIGLCAATISIILILKGIVFGIHKYHADTVKTSLDTVATILKSISVANHEGNLSVIYQRAIEKHKIFCTCKAWRRVCITCVFVTASLTALFFVLILGLSLLFNKSLLLINNYTCGILFILIFAVDFLCAIGIFFLSRKIIKISDDINFCAQASKEAWPDRGNVNLSQNTSDEKQ